MAEQLEPLHVHLEPKDIGLEEIFLDPNNPRFVGLTSSFVPDENVAEASVQAEALKTLADHFAIDRIRMNMEVNGYLPIDRIVVRPLATGKGYIVLEGNRRIAAAKTLPTYTQEGHKIDHRVSESVKVIPTLVYTGADTDASWLFQGIRHISGINDWSAYNKARLLVEQMEKDGLTLTAAGRRFGLTPFGAGQWVRSYYAFKQAKEETDYILEVDERLYPYLQELFGRSSIHARDWLGWDESDRKFKNSDLFNEFVGWFYPRDENEDSEEYEAKRGNWANKRLNNRDDIRQISYMIQKSPKNFQLFRSGLDFEAAYGQAMVEEYQKKSEGDVDTAEKVFRILDNASTSLRNIPLVMIKDTSLNERLKEALSQLEAAIGFVRN